MSFNFGSTNPPAFGTPNAAAGSITFGTPIAQPQAGSLFGTPANSAAPSFGFGATVSSAQSFGATPANTSLSFGAPANTNLSFGTPASTGLSFGTPANTNLSFGAPANTGLSFGAPVSTGLSFGAPVASTGLSFGTTAPVVSTAASSFNFGGVPTLGGFSTAAQPTLNFGAPKTTGALGFGTGTLGISTGFGTGAPTLGFGLSSANQPTNLLGVGTTSTAPSGGLNFGFGGGFGTLTTKPLTSTIATSAATAAPTLGLGGVATSIPITARLGGVATSMTTAAKTEISSKDQPLPNEILQTVEAFKIFIKQQEQYCSDISKVSIKEFKKVKEDIDAVNNKLTTTEKQLQSNQVTAEKLKYNTAKGLQQIEMAQRTHDTPPGLQYDNNAPLLFFIELVDSFEKEMQQIKLQIETTDKYIRNLGAASPLTSNDLSLGLRRLHDTFVALAGRLQSIHSQVEYHKEQYLNYRRFMLRDESETVTNVFERPTAESDALQIALRSIDAYHGLSGLGQLGRLSGGEDSGHKADAATVKSAVSSGPTPFGTSLDQTNVVQAQHQQHLQQQQQHQQQQAVQQVTAAGTTSMSLVGGTMGATLPTIGAPTAGPPPPYPGTTGMFGSTGTTGLLPGATSNFGSPATSGTLGSLATLPNPLGGYSPMNNPLSSAFPLQKPPVGNKRGKP